MAASSTLSLDVSARRGTFLRFLRGAVLGPVTFGWLDDDLHAPQRFEVLVKRLDDGSVLARLPAGATPQEAESLRALLSERAAALSEAEFIGTYCG